MRFPGRTFPRRWALSALLLATLGTTSPVDAAQNPGIVDGRSMRLAGNQAFTFTPSLAGGSVSWTIDRETIDDSGTHARTDGIQSASGLSASFSLSAVSGSETIYYITASDRGVEDTDTVQVFTPNIRTWFTYHSAGNPDVRVYAVVPTSLSPATRVLLAMHGNSRTASEYADIWRSWANQHDYLVLCPWYDEVNWPTTGMYQMGNVYEGDDCNGALNPRERWTFTIDLGIHQQARNGFGIVDPMFDMWGFSGGGQHIHRFMLYEPDAPVRLAMPSGSGWYTTPEMNTDCPYGVDDAPLTFTYQDLLNWTNRRMIIMVGTADTVRDEDLRTTERADAQGLNRYERADYMLQKGILFNHATRWSRVDVPNADHSAKPVAQMAMTLLQGSVLDTTPPRPPKSGGAVLGVRPNPLVDNGVLWGEGWGPGEVDVEIFDLLGRKIAAGTAPVSSGKWRVDWRNLAGRGTITSGIYMVRARDRDQQVEQKVLIRQ